MLDVCETEPFRECGDALLDHTDRNAGNFLTCQLARDEGADARSEWLCRAGLTSGSLGLKGGQGAGGDERSG